MSQQQPTPAEERQLLEHVLGSIADVVDVATDHVQQLGDSRDNLGAAAWALVALLLRSEAERLAARLAELGAGIVVVSSMPADPRRPG